MNAARHPSATSTSIGLVMALVQAQYLAAKMLSSSPDTRKHIFGASGLHTLITNHMFGIDQWKRGYAHFPFDGTVGAIGAFAFRDGIHHGGGAFSTVNPVGSVEAYEQEIPFLYLYRREVPGSGGHGQWRGGATFVSGWTGHKSNENYISSGGVFASVTQGVGLMGGYPGSGGTMWHALDTPILELLREGSIPSSSEELHAVAPQGSPPPPKKFDNRLVPGDLFEVMPQPGAGYGDPLLRDPRLVAADLREGRLSIKDAERIYGVVVHPDGSPDDAGTQAARERQMEQRRRDARAPRKAQHGVLEEVVASATGAVDIGRQNGKAALGCAHCGQVLGDVQQGYREGCYELQMPLPGISPLFMDPSKEIEGVVVLRLYVCPGCGLALDSEVCPPEEKPTRDVEFEPTIVSELRPLALQATVA
jgi:N-methylhydantoinase B